MMDTLAEILKKGVASCDNHRVGACNCRSCGSLIGIQYMSKKHVYPCLKERNSLNESIQVGDGKESNFAIPLVTASEEGTGQTERQDESPGGCGVVDPIQCFLK